MNPIQTLHRWATGHRNTSTAETAYWQADRRIGRLHKKLSRTQSPADRAPLLAELTEAARQQADVYPAAFGPDPIPEENGRDMAESLDLEADLYSLLADAEYAAAYGQPRYATNHLERHAGPILDLMANPDITPQARAALLDDLYFAVVEVVGGQAAEAIACLPAPGRPNPHSLRAILRNNTQPQHGGADRTGVKWRWLSTAAVLAAIGVGLDGLPATVLRTTAAVTAAWAVAPPRRRRPHEPADGSRDPQPGPLAFTLLAAAMALTILSMIFTNSWTGIALFASGAVILAGTMWHYWPRRNPTN